MPAILASFAQASEVMRERVETALDAYSQFPEECPARLQEAIRYSLLGGGKRLRPMLVLMAAQTCGCSWERAMPAACAVEMVHTYSLIHDDLPAMDDDDLRRGRPTSHKVFGEALAILAGDALLTLAFEVLATRIQPGKLAGPCCGALAQAAGAASLVGGQVDDLAAEGGNGGLAALESIHHRKTGAMLRVSLRLGGMCAEASAGQLAALDNFGQRLGLAFQITDDLLDVRGDEAAIGKRVRKDSNKGKLTFPRLLGIEGSNHRAAQLIDEACQALAPFGQQAAGLEALARFVLERNR